MSRTKHSHLIAVRWTWRALQLCEKGEKHEYRKRGKLFPSLPLREGAPGRKRAPPLSNTLRRPCLFLALFLFPTYGIAVPTGWNGTIEQWPHDGIYLPSRQKRVQRSEPTVYAAGHISPIQLQPYTYTVVKWSQHYALPREKRARERARPKVYESKTHPPPSHILPLVPLSLGFNDSRWITVCCSRSVLQRCLFGKTSIFANACLMHL